MATREEVLAAYAANPKAELNPSNEAINFWMNNDLGQFNTLVDQVRAANPTLASQIDAQRATATKTTTGGTTDNSALYKQLVLDAYNSIGRTGFGTGVKQIDQGGYDFWLNALQNGTLTPDTFRGSFNNAVTKYIQENPTNALTQSVQQYKPFQNVGVLQTQPNSLGASAVPGYQSPGLAGNFANYMGIPIGAQYNPGVTAGGASPYSQIKAVSPGFVNPYSNVIADVAMGGYNPMLYQNQKAQSLSDSVSQALQAETNPGMAKGGYVHGGLMSGPNPPGPDDGAVNLDIGEYVVKKSAVDKYGKGLLDMINEGKVPVKKAKSLLF
jgi:hypothetical protein